MAYKIDSTYCTGCGACQVECPNKAVVELESAFSILADKCTECVGYFDEPQCVAVCPADGSILIDAARPRSLTAA